MEEVLLENDRVRVLRRVLAPGESTGYCQRGDRVVIHLDAHEKRRMAHDEGDAQRDIARGPGDVHFMKASEHTLMNTGTSPATTILVELKTPGQVVD